MIDGYFYEEVDVPQLAERRGVAPSTVYSQKAKAQATLGGDDVFFYVLHSLNRVRDEARAKRLAEHCPNGVLPDGRRRVLIQNAA